LTYQKQLSFYQDWKKKNPTQKRFNKSLKEYINIRYISIDETTRHASKNYLSTLAVLQLDTILENAKKYDTVKSNPNRKNQNDFSDMILMSYELVGIGKVKLTVGIKRKGKAKIQYCITVIK
jgi:hypothetical protein